MVVLTGEHDPQASLQLHTGIVAGHKRLDDNRRSQIALEQPGQAIDGGLTVPHPLRLHALNRQKCVRRIVGQRRSNAVAPVPAASHGTRIVDIGKLTGQRRIIRLLAKWQERVAAVGHRQAQIALNSMQILTADGQRIGQ